jgi:hypothetical protein
MAETEILGVVDRIEGNKAVVEMFEPTDWRLIFPAAWLPEQREGMVLEFVLRDRPKIEERRRQRIQQLQDELIEKPDSE